MRMDQDMEVMHMEATEMEVTAMAATVAGAMGAVMAVAAIEIELCDEDRKNCRLFPRLRSHR